MEIINEIFKIIIFVIICMLLLYVGHVVKHKKEKTKLK